MQGLKNGALLKEILVLDEGNWTCSNINGSLSPPFKLYAECMFTKYHVYTCNHALHAHKLIYIYDLALSPIISWQLER